MKTTQRKILMGLLAAVFVAGGSGCTKEIVKEREVGPGAVTNGGPRETVSVNGVQNDDELTEAGEQLIGPFTFHLADRAFALALEKNPSNKKAQFYREFLKQFMIFRGALDRVRPYARQYGNIASLEKTIRDLPDHPLKHFLMDSSGQAPIRDVGDIQNFLIQYRNAVNDFRVFIAKNPDLDFAIYLNPSLWKDQIDERIRNSCVVTGAGDDFQVSCDTSSAARVKMNVADLQVVRQYEAGVVLYLTLYTSYSVKGLDQLFADVNKASIEECTAESTTVVVREDNSPRRGHRQGRSSEVVTVPTYTPSVCTHPYHQLTPREVIERLQEAPEALKLNRDNGLSVVRSIGSEFTTAFKWAMKQQSRLCREGHETSKNRPGYAFDRGLCIQDWDGGNNLVALFDQALSGVVHETVVTKMGQDLQTDVNYLAIVDHPVADLRQFAPTGYDKCNAPVGLLDPTLGGTFPKGDGNMILLETCQDK